MRFAQTVSIDFGGAPSTRRPFDSMAVTEIRVSPRSSSSPTVTSSSGANSREVFSERSSQDTTKGTEIGFGSRVTTFEMASHFEHRTTPSKTISSFPPILPRRTRCGPTSPHWGHFKTRALGATIVNVERGGCPKDLRFGPKPPIADLLGRGGGLG